MRTLAVFFICLIPFFLQGQEWIDTIYTIHTETDVTYGVTTGFAGAEDTLLMDISYPTNDTINSCGRPLLVMVHGGAWIAGNKGNAIPSRIREDFAKRGYTTASVNYRLGQFHTNQFINCNVPTWNCYNMTDSSEWYRANYRGIQDVHGAIRYLINRADEYKIDTNNVFLVGESAGGFIAMGVGFLDDSTEVLANLVDTYPDAPAPNQLYQGPCIQTYQLADNIDAMDLSRSALGHYQGTLNPSQRSFHIRAVGNFYGGAFNDIFTAHHPDPPGLYLYHQPCDLIVPYRYGRALAGYVNCLQGFPTFCGYIVNRPLVYGSLGIRQLIDTLSANGLPTSDYLFDNSNDNFNCLQQTSTPCHSIDNFWLRTANMASYFAEKMDRDSCFIVSTENPVPTDSGIKIYPNPALDRTTIEFDEIHREVVLIVTNTLGQIVMSDRYEHRQTIDLDLSRFQPGIYQICCKIDDRLFCKKLVLGSG